MTLHGWKKNVLKKQLRSWEVFIQITFSIDWIFFRNVWRCQLEHPQFIICLFFDRKLIKLVPIATIVIQCKNLIQISSFYTEGPCLMRLLVLGKSRISQILHYPNIWLMCFLGQTITAIFFFIRFFERKYFTHIPGLNLRMKCWCLQISQKTNQFFSRISVLASKKRSNQKNKGTLYHSPSIQRTESVIEGD